MTASGESEIRVPDGIEPIVGCRCWKYDLTTDRPSLLSLAAGEAWRIGGWTRATCRAGDRVGSRHSIHTSDHQAPLEGCSCGLYALREQPPLSLLAQYLPARTPGELDRGVIWGRVQLAGKVIEHEEGYRGELARVLELVPVRGQESVAQMLAATYHARVSSELSLLDPVREQGFEFPTGQSAPVPPVPAPASPGPPTREVLRASLGVAGSGLLFLTPVVAFIAFALWNPIGAVLARALLMLAAFLVGSKVSGSWRRRSPSPW